MIEQLDGVVLPWCTNGDPIHDVDAGGHAAKAWAREVLTAQKNRGAIAVRVACREEDRAWWRERHDETETPVAVGLTWNSCFKRPDPGAQAKWMKYGTKLCADMQPDIVCVDRETRTDEYPQTPGEVRQMVNTVVKDGQRVPIGFYDGPKHFWPGVGNFEGPRFYKLRAPQESYPKQVRRWIEVDKVPVYGGLPWLSPCVDAWHTKTSNFMPAGEFKEACQVLADAGAKGFCLFPSYYSPELDIGDPRHELLLKYMAEGADVFRNAGK